MRVLAAFIVAILIFGMAAEAQEKRVAPKDSRILLLAPHLENIQPTYQYFGWNAQASVETAYAGVARDNSTPARAQVYLNLTAPMTYWQRGNALDAAWIRGLVPFFKDRDVQVTAPAPAPGPFVRVARFEVDAAKCMTFELRHIVNNPGGVSSLEERQSVAGIYCPPSGVALDDALIQHVFEGIFVRRDGLIERALRGVDKPIPPQLLRGERQQG
ncbi:MAG: hypothetical protein EXR12_00385 [Rhodospirillaceae bacterium]|nr:hypothetical protein [Rhodospirillaceae bacterium]